MASAPAASESKIMDITDPHMHIWECNKAAKDRCGHSGDILGAVADDSKGGHSTFLMENYAADAAELRTLNMSLSSCVFLEAIAEDGIDEAEWLERHKMFRQPEVTVAYLDLSLPAVEVAGALQKLSSMRSVRGIRQILNFDPTWPKVKADLLQDPTHAASFRTGFALLQDVGFSFDAQLNPHQFEAAYNLFKDFPKIAVIVNHAGCLKANSSKEVVDVWRAGMKKLASLDHVSIKLSMFAYTYPNFCTDDEAKKGAMSMARELIDMFGPLRCMFASNWPVDKTKDVSMATLFKTLASFVTDRSEQDRRALFSTNARRIYRMQ